MPTEVKQMILERQMIKEDERRINLEMRRLAEEEIMRELRMAEDYFVTTEFQKTNKIFPLYSAENEGHKDDDEFERDDASTVKEQDHLN